jgi:hypothetical protein
MAIISKRMTAQIEGDFVIFLIGMRINRPWKVRSWFPVFTAMPKMLRELRKQPEMGLLGYEQVLGSPRSPMVIQYWRSFEQLEAYARSKDATHFPAWVKFNQKVGSNGDVGIWHETYLVRAGDHESIYNNMPLHGLAKASSAVPAAGARKSAPQRLGVEGAEGYPAEAELAE